jgi:N-acetylglucosamine kinase-like BadF-type ATPase
MTTEIFVGLDSGGTRTNVAILIVESSEKSTWKRYEASDSLSGALEPARIPQVLGHVLAPLAMHLEDRALVDAPTYIWISAAGYSPWTRDEFTTAMCDVGPTLGAQVIAMGAANDAVSMLLGSGADGVIVAGTGSSVIVRAHHGELYQAGGHEWVASDYGAGFWIGLEAIRRAFRDFEAGTDSVLLQRLRQTYGVRAHDDKGLIAKMRDLAIADPNMKKEIGKFAASVCGAAERGDADSQNLVKAAAEDLADVTAVSLRRRFSYDELAAGLTLVQNGSLLNNPFYQTAFESQVEMRMRSGFEKKISIKWKRTLTVDSACVDLAQQLKKPLKKIVTIATEFRPSIVNF